MNDPKLSVVICAYNPKPEIFNQVLESLKSQTLDENLWEVLIIDNNSVTPLTDWVDTAWHPKAKIIVETESGLIFSRIRGNKEAKGDYVVTVDDDTPLNKGYLKTVADFFAAYQEVGILGGKCFPIYETENLPEWINLLPSSISGRDFGNKIIFETHDVSKILTAYPKFSPILMSYKRSVFDEFVDQFDEVKNGVLGRKGNSLASGEDNDIVLFFYKTGWATAYCPELSFSHYIPKERLTFDYAKKLLFESSRSWVKVLYLHQICPWPKIARWTLILRAIKSFVFLKAWAGKIDYLKWKASCGTFKGLSEI